MLCKIACQGELYLLEVCGFVFSLLVGLFFVTQKLSILILWCSWFCNFHRYIGELFAPVPCKVSIYKSSPFHFGPVRTRILRLLAAMKNVVSPFHVCLLMQLHFSFPSVLPFPGLSFSTSNSLKCGPISLFLVQ